jgi:hypothetical protein
MELYVVSKNSGPTWTGLDIIKLIYLGTSFEEAIDSVGDMRRYEKEPYTPNKIGDRDYFYSALPQKVERKIVRWYAADGWWVVIEVVQFN